MPTIDALHMSARDIGAACKAWQMGGCLALGVWLSRYKPRFSTRDYGALVQLVREELDDWTDYSRELAQKEINAAYLATEGV